MSSGIIALPFSFLFFLFSNKMAPPSVPNTVGCLVLYLRLVRIPKLSAFFPIATSHLEFLLNSLLSPFILLTLSISSCLHCFTFTRPLLTTRPSPTFFHSPEQHKHQAHKRDHLELQDRSSCSKAPALGGLLAAPKALMYLPFLPFL